MFRSLYGLFLHPLYTLPHQLSIFEEFTYSSVSSSHITAYVQGTLQAEWLEHLANETDT
jgi:hypothetical protein